VLAQGFIRRFLQQVLPQGFQLAVKPSPPTEPGSELDGAAQAAIITQPRMKVRNG